MNAKKQHRDVIRKLQSTLFDPDKKHTVDERVAAGHDLIEVGTRDEVVETFIRQIQAAKPEDELVNKFIIGILYEAYHDWKRIKASKVKQTRLFWVKDGKLYPTVEIEADNE